MCYLSGYSVLFPETYHTAVDISSRTCEDNALLVRYASNILTTNYYYVWYHLLHISPHYPLPSCFRFTAFSAQWMDPCFACKCAFEFGESSS